MDAVSILNILLPAVFVLVGIALIWLLVELVRTLRGVRKMVNDVQVNLTPTIAHLESITRELEPVVTRVDPLVERLSLTVDAANLEMMRVDQILEDVGDVTGTLSKTSNAIDNVTSAPVKMVTSVSDRVRKVFNPSHGSEESARLAEAAHARFAEDEAAPENEYTEELLAQLEAQEAELMAQAAHAEDGQAQPAEADASAFDFTQFDAGFDAAADQAQPAEEPEAEPEPEPEEQPKDKPRYYTYAMAADSGAASVPSQVPDPIAEVADQAPVEAPEAEAAPEEGAAQTLDEFLAAPVADDSLSEQDTGEIPVNAVAENLQAEDKPPVDFSDLFDLGSHEDEEPADAGTDFAALDSLANSIVAPEPEEELPDTLVTSDALASGVLDEADGATADPAAIADELSAMFAGVPAEQPEAVEMSEAPAEAELPADRPQDDGFSEQATGEIPVIDAAISTAEAPVSAEGFTAAPAEAVSAFAAGSALEVTSEAPAEVAPEAPAEEEPLSLIDEALARAKQRLVSDIDGATGINIDGDGAIGVSADGAEAGE